MARRRKSKQQPKIEAQQVDQREFIDPSTTATVFGFLFVEIAKACVAFFTMKALRIWWAKKYGKDEYTDVGEDQCYQGTSDKGVPEEESQEKA